MSDPGGKVAASVARDGRSVGVAPLACRRSVPASRHDTHPAQLEPVKQHVRRA